MKRSVLILATTDAARDARVHRQIIALHPEWQVTCAAAGKPDADCEFIKLEMYRLRGWNPLRNRSVRLYERCLLELRQFRHYYWRQRWARKARARLSVRNWDAIIANDLDTLPLAIEIAGESPVLFDAHEYYPGQHPTTTRKQELLSQYSIFLCNQYAHRARGMTTVSGGIADKYNELVGAKASVIENCPGHADLEPRDRKDGKIKLIHHGACRLNRGIERLIQMTELLDHRFELHLMLTGDRSRGDFRSLTHLAKGRNIAFPEPVKVEEITHVINKFDLGVYILPPESENHRLALPNKFFDFIQARLGIAIGPSPEMARIVKCNDLGVVADDFLPESLAAQLNSLSEQDIARFKRNSHLVAKQYSAETVSERLKIILAEYVK